MNIIDQLKHTVESLMLACKGMDGRHMVGIMVGAVIACYIWNTLCKRYENQ